MAGQVEGRIVNLPLGLNFTQRADGRALVQFNTSPAVGEDHLQIEGELEPIVLGNLLRIEPIGFPEVASLGGAIRVTRTEDRPAISVGILPARITLLGGLKGRIFGGDLDQENLDTSNVRGVLNALDETRPFTYSSVEGQPWSGVIRLDGNLEIRNPLDSAGPVLFAAATATQNDVPVPFIAEIEGVGAKEFEVRLTIPNGVTFTLFPGTDQEASFTAGSNSATCLFIHSDGRVYFDSGTQDLDLPFELGSVRGRVELGYQPSSRTPILTHSTPDTFTASLGSSVTQTITVTNSRSGISQLVVDASLTDSEHFSVFPSRVIVGGGESADLTVRFSPRSATITSSDLVLESNASANPRIEIPFAPAVTTSSKIHVDTKSIDFGLSPLGIAKSQILRVSNTGDADLLVSSVSLSASALGFTEDAATLVIPPLGSKDIAVSFQPRKNGTVNASLRINSNAGTATVTLSGRGGDRFWYRQRRGTGIDSLQAIAMKPEIAVSPITSAHAAGAFGNHLTTSTSNGRAWTRRGIAGMPRA
ncbi:MAG: hypothetical protein ACI8UO_006631 [Verrucomicrobiales bacterium]|jgi:hypothetical protein